MPALGSTAVLCTGCAAGLAAAEGELVRELDAIDRACSRFRLDSELTVLNGAAGRPVQVTSLLMAAIRVALRAAEATGGLVDPTIGRGLRAVGYDRPFARIRPRRSLGVRFEPAAGWRLVEVDADAQTVRLPRDVELDLGATAKALAADRAARAAAAVAGTGVLVGLGGDISLAGESVAGGWPVRIADDHGAALDSPGLTVALRSGGLATSSVTVRRWRIGDAELHHVLDPRTGWPAETCWRTATVAAATCVDANTASTAAILLGEAAPEWLAERDLPARLVRHSGDAVCVGGWPRDDER